MLLLIKLILLIVVAFTLIALFNRIMGKKKDLWFYNSWGSKDKPSESFNMGLPKSMEGYLISLILILIMFFIAILVLKFF